MTDKLIMKSLLEHISYLEERQDSKDSYLSTIKYPINVLSVAFFTTNLGETECLADPVL